MPTWLRRIYADPAGAVVATTSRRRFVPDGLAAQLRVRDQGLCRTPCCDAPIRHLDHVEPVAGGGLTTVANTQGLCEACNHTKQAPGWGQRALDPDVDVGVDGSRHTVRSTTPTGHQVDSVAPAPPRPAAPRLAAPRSTPTAWDLDLRYPGSWLDVELDYAA